MERQIIFTSGIFPIYCAVSETNQCRSVPLNRKVQNAISRLSLAYSNKVSTGKGTNQSPSTHQEVGQATLSIA